MLQGAVLVLMCVSLSSALRILSWPPLNCSQRELNCTVTSYNCIDPGWTTSYQYTPTGPEGLEGKVITRRDEKGHLHPVLDAKWNLRDDGSLSHVQATELHVLVVSTNGNHCVRYTFQNQLGMRTKKLEKWSFSADMVVLEPGHSYRVSVFNIPKPEEDHSKYDVSLGITVPPCKDPAMKMTQFCIERGSLWQSNISIAQTTEAGGRSALAVSFNQDRLCKDYMILVRCGNKEIYHSMYGGNETTLTATFGLDRWPRSCCKFMAQIKPIYPKCGQDCTRHEKLVDICPSPPVPVNVNTTDAPQYTYVFVGIFLLIVAIAAIVCILCRKSDNRVSVPPVKEDANQPVRQTPKVLVIYSQDHHLYRDVVLKLCAFLQAQCGVQVLMDQLDSTSVSMVGRLRWLEWQRQQLKNPSDKILVLCSRGVQAKWRAVCGQGRVMLREDVLSPTDDMLTPFLNLFLPDMHQAGMHGKYMVAYFDDICSEGDVPSVFDIAVKYKLMKHFEELYFRILGVEKYQPDQVKQVKCIGVDEYFKCASGRALRNAIETFQAYQSENPDWFEKECVASEEEAIAGDHRLIDELQTPLVLESLPLIRDGPPVYVNEFEVNGNGSGVHVLTPEVNPAHQMFSVTELTPLVNTECVGPSYLHDVSPEPRDPRGHPSVRMVEPVLVKSSPLKQNHVAVAGDPVARAPVEHDEDDLLPERSPPASRSVSMFPGPDSPPPSEMGHAEPMQMDEEEVLELTGKGPSSGSDQGYISRASSQGEPPHKEDPLVALRRLQEELYGQNLMYSDSYS